MKYLKHIRRVVAFIVLLLSLLMFVDFGGLLPIWMSDLMRVQFVPALISNSWVIVGVLILSAILLGRLYCSVLCPFGIMQDAISWVKRAYLKITKKKKSRLLFTKQHKYIRYGFMFISFIPLLLGYSFILLLLDPYSNFGRITYALMRPLYIFGNNIMASVAQATGNYSLYNVTPNFDIPLLIFSSIIFVMVVVMSWRRERLWCNTICPVGTLLGVISRYSLVKVNIDKSKCSGCSRCSNVCKSHCIDIKNRDIDNSRCVSCYNCLSVCKDEALKYNIPTTRKNKKEEKQTISYSFDSSRKEFIVCSLTALGSIPFIGIASSVNKALSVRSVYPVPPGAVDNFGNKCTGCQLCVSRCPMHVLRPAFTERGLMGIMQPIMYFKPHCYCNYECTICSEVCPNGALMPLTVEQKKIRQVGYVNFVLKECVVEALGQDCGACAEHCPTGAVRMIPYKDGHTIPHIEPEKCIGCGACESICPVRPLAIFIEGNKIQVDAEKPDIQEKEEVKVDGFGF